MTLIGILNLIQFIVAVFIGIFLGMVMIAQSDAKRYVMVVGSILATVVSVCVAILFPGGLFDLWVNGVALGLISGLALSYGAGTGRF